MEADHILSHKLCQGADGLDTVEGHNEALQLPHVLHSECEAGLREDLLLFSSTINLSQESMLVGQQLIHKVLSRLSDIPVGKVHNELLDLDPFIEVARGAQVFVLCGSC